jgi:hypothetical protein
VPIDVSAPAELFRKGQHVPAHGLKEPHTFGDLMQYVMEQKWSWRQKLTPQGTPSPSKAGPPLRPHCLPSNWTAPQVATRCDDS